jgi:predicted RNase H-like nuclease (RuvC/YqgF family)
MAAEREIRLENTGSEGQAKGNGEFEVNRMTARKTFTKVLVMLAVVALALPVAAQGEKPRHKTRAQLATEIAAAKANVVSAATAYKASLEKLITYLEADVKTAEEAVETRKALMEQSIVSKREVEEKERELNTARRKLDEARRQITETDMLIAEASEAEHMPAIGPGVYDATAALIRYNGTSHWSLAEISKVEGYFTGTFGHALPISAYGQSAIHDKMGFDHRNAVDVAVFPDSAEGEALMAYLRSQGIPFIAFRHAVPGSATGAHIHIGFPSKRR